MSELLEDVSFFKELFDALPDIIIWRKPIFAADNTIVDFEISYINESGHKHAGRPKEELLGTNMFSDRILSPEVGQLVFDQCLEVYQTGGSKEYSYYSPTLGYHVDAIRKRFRDGILTIIQDKTLLRTSEQKEQEHIRLLKTIVENAPAGIVSYAAVRDEQQNIVDFNAKFFNQEVNRLTGFSEHERSSLPLSRLLVGSGLEQNFLRYKQTVETGVPFTLELYFSKTAKWLSFKGVKLDDGFISIVSDITESKEIALKIETQKNLLDNIMKYSHNGISVTKVIRNKTGEIVDGITILANDSANQYIGKPDDIHLRKTIRKIEPNIADDAVFNLAVETLKTGVPLHTQYLIESSGKWIELSISKMDDDHLINVFTDITDTKKAQLDVQQTSEYLQHILNTAQTGIFLFSPIFDEHGTLIDFRFVTANRALAAYVGQQPDAVVGELGSKWFPDYKTNGLFEYYGNTYLTGKANRFDFHYVGGSIDVWLDIQSTKMHDQVLVTFSDYTPLKQLQQQLELSVEELKRSNANLEEFAYAASHDLKEPIRKIHFFAERIKTKYVDVLDEQGLRTFDRLQVATQRMQLLVDDLLSYSHVSLKPVSLENIDLNEKVKVVLMDLELAVDEKQAEVHYENLPVVKGHRRQIQQLFQNLISNSLKYSKPGERPVIQIKSSIIQGRKASIAVLDEDKYKEFYQIDLKDNGIGFKQENAELIFRVFQRLHSDSEFRGTGVGLSIARKVVENHGGYIWAESEPGNGAVFHILLPIH